MILHYIPCVLKFIPRCIFNIPPKRRTMDTNASRLIFLLPWTYSGLQMQTQMQVCVLHHNKSVITNDCSWSIITSVEKSYVYHLINAIRMRKQSA